LNDIRNRDSESLKRWQGGICTICTKCLTVSATSLLKSPTSTPLPPFSKLHCLFTLHTPEPCLQVTVKLCNACKHVADHAPSFSKGDANMLIDGAVDKFSDMKIKSHVADLLTALAEVRTTPPPPREYSHDRWRKSKPTIHSRYCIP
jgi:hypothetical protein